MEPFLIARAASTDGLIELLDRALIEAGRVQPGDAVIMTAGAPPGTAGSTNNVRVHIVGASDGS